MRPGLHRLLLPAIAWAFVAGTPAAASPWAEACDRFYALADLTPPATSEPPDIAALKDHYRRAEAIGFSGAAAVQQGGKTLLNEGYGFADWHSGAPMTPDTVFDIGSVSKQFTAAAVLKLEEQARLRVEDPITRFFANVPADKRTITIHQLLTHSAGFPHDVRPALDTSTRDAMIEAALEGELKSAPGTRYSYSNTGYALLAAIVEIASGTTYENHLRRELWLPAGMRRTGWVLFDRSDATFATGYDATGATATPVPHNWIEDGPTWGRRGPGAILSTMNELRRWATALRQGEILSEASLTKMLSPQIREDTDAPSYYGYGWAISASSDGSCVIFHNGSNNLHYNMLAIYPEKNLISQAAALQSLGPMRRRVIGAAARVLFGGEGSQLPQTPQLAPAEAKRLAGVWRDEDGAEVRMFARGSRLILPATDPAVARLFTPFPPLPPNIEKRIAPVRARLSAIIDRLAEGDYRPLIASLASSSTPEGEDQYWSRQWPEWVREHGAYRGNELIATSRRGDNWVTWVLLRFDRRSILVAANYGADGKVLIGNDTFVEPEVELLPSEFVLAPTGKNTFGVFNTSLPGSVEVSFDPDARRMRIRCPRGETQLVRAPIGGKMAAR